MFGFFDKTGARVLTPRYDQNTHGFSNGLAATEIGTRYGFIDQTGKMVVAAQFATAGPFREGLARVQLIPKGPWGIATRAGR